VLDEGNAGLLVPAREPEQLAEAILSLLNSPDRRAALGETLRARARRFYSAESVIRQVCEVYEQVLRAKNGRGLN
jgi:glycosyltransferase involved in cell wall biosynthesis